MEVVRFLEKNAGRYSIDKDLVYSKTVEAFKARVSARKLQTQNLQRTPYAKHLMMTAV